MSPANLVPAGLKPSKEEVDVLLELAYLSTAVDGRLYDEELAAFKGIVARLRGAPPSAADIDALMDRFGRNVDHAAFEDRVRALAPKLAQNLKPVAFKLAVALGLADLDASRAESKLQAALADALGLGRADVDDLTAEVYASLDAGEDP